MKKYLLIMAAFVSTSFFVGCETDDEFTAPNYAALEMGPVNTTVPLSGSTTYDVSVYTANIVSNDRIFDIEVRDATTLSEEAYSIPETVTVPGGTNEGVFTVNVDDVNLTPNGAALILGISSAEDVLVGDDFRLNVSWSCDNPLTVDFAFDAYASETSWNVVDNDGTVLLSGGGFADGAEAANVSRCLPDGEYTFTVFDSYGDGMSEAGSVTLSYAGEELVVIPGDFISERSVDFTLGEDAGAGDPYVNEDEDTDDSEGDDSEGDDSEGDDSEGDDSEGDDSEGDDSEGDDSEGDDSEGDDSEGDDSEGDDSEGDDSEGDDSEGDDSEE
ncbi:hypothetical protein RM549_06530 [Salegentibacter sp. F188]|uniref:DUF1735 domain-containing protein n=1 Tax=Autumnicola patrickiae TaxID=3075591 RepID=A0ABU3E0D2_9FLAO|nr:hypothetical protein [Salegentibacter sp. F188]MDT0689433.1 hypothetical protein [Salegentibacter sp. F188]